MALGRGRSGQASPRGVRSGMEWPGEATQARLSGSWRGWVWSGAVRQEMFSANAGGAWRGEELRGRANRGDAGKQAGKALAGPYRAELGEARKGPSPSVSAQPMHL